jgi:hypothetical protein
LELKKTFEKEENKSSWPWWTRISGNEYEGTECVPKRSSYLTLHMLVFCKKKKTLHEIMRFSKRKIVNSTRHEILIRIV